MSTYTTESILASLGFSDPLDAARQQARIILLGRLARYEAIFHQFQQKKGCTLEELRQRYLKKGNKNREDDDDYLEWQWYSEASEAVKNQLAALSTPTTGP